MTSLPLRFLPLLVVLAVGCASSRAAQTDGKPASTTSDRPTYGFSSKDPIKVGGGVEGENQFLSFLRGPDGEPVVYKRLGSCCGFDTPNAPMGGGLLDIYAVTYAGLAEPVELYLNMYDREEPVAPQGFVLR